LDSKNNTVNAKILFFSTRGLNATEIQGMLENMAGDEAADVVLFPPEDDEVTDEDSDEEDDLLPKDPNHLGRGVLLQQAELVIHTNSDELPDVGVVNDEGDIVPVNEDDEQPGPSDRTPTARTPRTSRTPRSENRNRGEKEDR